MKPDTDKTSTCFANRTSFPVPSSPQNGHRTDWPTAAPDVISETRCPSTPNAARRTKLLTASLPYNTLTDADRSLRQQQTAPAVPLQHSPGEVLAHPLSLLAVLRDISCHVCANTAMADLSVRWQYVVTSPTGVGEAQDMASRQEIRLALCLTLQSLPVTVSLRTTRFNIQEEMRCTYERFILILYFHVCLDLVFAYTVKNIKTESHWDTPLYPFLLGHISFGLLNKINPNIVQTLCVWTLRCFQFASLIWENKPKLWLAAQSLLFTLW